MTGHSWWLPCRGYFIMKVYKLKHVSLASFGWVSDTMNSGKNGTSLLSRRKVRFESRGDGGLPDRSGSLTTSLGKSASLLQF